LRRSPAGPSEGIKSPLLLCQIVALPVDPCRFIRNSARSAAGSCRHVTARFVASEQPRSNHGATTDPGCAAHARPRSAVTNGDARMRFSAPATALDALLGMDTATLFSAFAKAWLPQVGLGSRGLVDRTLFCNQCHRLCALRELEALCNTHQPHRGVANACPLPPPIADPDTFAACTSDDANVWAESSTRTNMQLNLGG
jgi:hypothetical protein